MCRTPSMSGGIFSVLGREYHPGSVAPLPMPDPPSPRIKIIKSDDSSPRSNIPSLPARTSEFIPSIDGEDILGRGVQNIRPTDPPASTARRSPAPAEYFLKKKFGGLKKINPPNYVILC